MLFWKDPKGKQKFYQSGIYIAVSPSQIIHTYIIKVSKDDGKCNKEGTHRHKRIF